MAKKRRTSSPVSFPLSPTILTEIGGLTAPPPPANGFRPDGDWTAWYRIWTCYGHRERSNATVGALRIARSAGAKTLGLAVRQTLRNSQGKLHTIEARVQCRRDELACPTAWTLTSRFHGSHMDGLPPMGVQQTGQIRESEWTTSAGGTPWKRRIAPPVTADWCLFEAVQRLPFRSGKPRTFGLLEGLSVLKEDHRLGYRGRLEVTWGPQKLRLHRFDHLGRGVYPYEYWLDDAHRLLLVTTGPRTYILDPKAEKLTAAGGTKR